MGSSPWVQVQGTVTAVPSWFVLVLWLLLPVFGHFVAPSAQTPFFGSLISKCLTPLAGTQTPTGTVDLGKVLGP